MNFVAVFKFVLIAIFLPTPFVERYFRIFDSDIDLACQTFCFGCQLFVASIGIRIFGLCSGDKLGVCLLAISMTAIVYMIQWNLGDWLSRINLAYNAHMEASGIQAPKLYFMGVGFKSIRRLALLLGMLQASVALSPCIILLSYGQD
eukprot:TRINITY_DN47075_c0_g1_i1.p1 TRINITY_DN47075_c0_g1~~TRINITY_DN47075_c0_g1_i1.p1  ORF type:complete len:147 (+),score=11.09 TRINITY_DN47075_c0_g1_i1:491-931(+)